jgi:hypothetical protein
LPPLTVTEDDELFQSITGGLREIAQKISRLQDENSRLQEENSSLQKENSRLREENTDLMATTFEYDR